MFAKQLTVFMLLAVSSSAMARTITNECQFPVGVAFAYHASNGTDGLGQGEIGSHPSTRSEGWFRIGPGQSIEAPARYTHLLVINGKTILSDISSRGDRMKTMGACADFTTYEGTKPRMWEFNNFDRPAGIRECFYENTPAPSPHRWLPYERFNNDYTIRYEVCGRKSNPANDRLVWRWTDGKTETFYAWKEGKEWASVSNLNDMKAPEIIFRAVEASPEWLVLSKQDVSVLLGKGFMVKNHPGTSVIPSNEQVPWDNKTALGGEWVH